MLVGAGKSPLRRQGVVRPVSPLPGFPSQGRRRFSQVPREPHCAFALLSDSGRASTPGFLRRFGIALVPTKDEGPSELSAFGALSHGLCTGCLRFVPSSRTTTQNSLPVADQPFRVGFPIPTEFIWRVSHFRAPLSQGFSWREAVLIMVVRCLRRPLCRATLSSCVEIGWTFRQSGRQSERQSGFWDNL